MNYNKKIKMVWLGGLLVFLLAYYFSISKTFEYASDCSSLEKKSENAASAPAQLAVIKSQLEQFNAVMVKDDGNPVHEKVLEAVTNFCRENGGVLREYPHTVTREEKDLIIETNYFEVEGNFHSLVKLVYFLEKKNKVGKLSSASFEMKKDANTKTTSLLVKIFIQNIKKKNHEIV